ncbi:MAG: hemerythrin domain-containing protein [Acidimicrobiales bacterium]
MTITQPLRDEHAELAPHIEALRVAGDAVGQFHPELKRLVDASYEFLVDHLIPHAEAEELALYPAVQRVVGATEATATMARDHVEVRTLTDELARYRDELATAPLVDARLANGLRRVLYGLHHLVKLHFAKEEEVYLPILDQRLTHSEAEAMFTSMHPPHRHR